MTKHRKGFTLIELLVVVLIIGVLAAIALPMYQKAVLRSRFAALMPIAKSMADSNEAYYLEHGQYASDPQALPVQGQLEYPTGTTLEFGSNLDYAYVLATNSNARNNYVVYQKHSENYPGEIHCEALTGDELAESICASFGNGTGIGTTLTDGYTTYVIEGIGAGMPAGADDNAQSCNAVTALGLTCSITTNEQGQTVKQVCKNGFCRTKTYNEDGSYTSITCKSDGSNGENVCTSHMVAVTYDANGNKLTQRECRSVDRSGNCTGYTSNDAFNYTYDANGNMVSSRRCSSVDSNGDCAGYETWADTNYTYDANGNKLTQRQCSSIDNSGACTEYEVYGSHYDYTYDANGNMLSSQYCNNVDSSGNCTEYGGWGMTYTYDANGHMLTQRDCFSLSTDGSCSDYCQGDCDNIDYTYDANGHMISARYCYDVGSNGNCEEYEWGRAEYTYDANGNPASQVYCREVDGSGNCTEYYEQRVDYIYDDNGQEITEQTCYSNNYTAGECDRYNYATMPYY